MKADRLLSVLLLLQVHGRLTGRELSHRLEVSARTVHRDMEALSAAGVPVFAERGARGGWQLDEGWRTSVPGLEEAELRALVMAQPPRVLGDLRLASAAERALGKLMASLPAGMRQQAVSIRQRLHVDVEGWRGGTENLAMLPTVQDAVWRDRRLAIRYSRGGRDMIERTIDPLGLVVKGNAWYLVAKTPDGLRTFRVSRIEQATLLDSATERPPDFDLVAFWRNSTKEYRGTFPKYTATVRLAERAASWLKSWRSVWLVESMSDADENGWVTLRLHFDCEEEACFMVLGLGSRAEVIDPLTLRDRVHCEAEGILARARTSTVHSPAD
jgi:predicted DNA-binding transcriptional regulator YafY